MASDLNIVFLKMFLNTFEVYIPLLCIISQKILLFYINIVINSFVYLIDDFIICTLHFEV